MRIFITAIFFFLTLTSPVFANSSIVINEVLPNPLEGEDWVELYNSSPEEVDLSGWILKDETSVMLEIKEASISASGLKAFEVGTRLNKNSDVVYLLRPDSENPVNQYSYSSNPGDNVSLGRFPDGSSSWGLCTPTKESRNECVIPTATPTITPTPTSTPKPTSTPNPTSTPKPEATEKPADTPTPTDKPASEAVLGETLGEVKEAVYVRFPTLTASEAASLSASLAGLLSPTATPSAGFFKPWHFLFLGLSAIVAMIVSAFKVSQKRKS